jgi:hypothetical protein
VGTISRFEEINDKGAAAHAAVLSHAGDTMSIDELQRHNKILEDQLEWDDDLSDRIKDVEASIDNLYQSQNALVDLIKETVHAINHNAELIAKAIDGQSILLREIAAAINIRIAAPAAPAGERRKQPKLEVVTPPPKGDKPA